MIPLELRILRDTFTPRSTTGILSWDGRPFGCVCEDVDRGLAATMTAAEIAAVKVRGRTAIPVGRYRIAITLSARFGRRMPLLLDVPGFRGIRIHAGNTSADTEGCLLPGMARGPDCVTRSAVAVRWLERELAAVLDEGREAWITIERDAAGWGARG